MQDLHKIHAVDAWIHTIKITTMFHRLNIEITTCSMWRRVRYGNGKRLDPVSAQVDKP